MKGMWAIEVDTVEIGTSEYDLFADGWEAALSEGARIVGFVKSDGYVVTKVAIRPKEAP